MRLNMAPDVRLPPKIDSTANSEADTVEIKEEIDDTLSDVGAYLVGDLLQVNLKEEEKESTVAKKIPIPESKPARTYACTICFASFPDAQTTLLHIRAHNGNRKVSQKDAQKVAQMYTTKMFKSQSKKRRAHEYDRAKNFSCSFCVRTFQCLRDLNRHKPSHLLPCPYKCSTCGALFARCHDLDKHQQEVSHGFGRATEATSSDQEKSQSTADNSPSEESQTFDSVLVVAPVASQPSGEADNVLVVDPVASNSSCEATSVNQAKSQATAVNSASDQSQTLESVLVVAPVTSQPSGEASSVLEVAPTKPKKPRPAYYPCRLCIRSFSSLRDLTRHRPAHQLPVSFKCSCTALFSLKQHLTQHLLKTGHSPEDADFKAITSGNLKKKKRAREKSQGSAEDLVDSQLTDQPKAAKKKTKWKPPPPISCPDCPRTFGAPWRLKKHLTDHQTLSSPWVCHLCGALYSEEGGFSRHHNRVHSAASAPETAQEEEATQAKSERIEYPCEFCGQVFAVPSVLAKHHRLHTNERPYPCKACPYRARTLKALKSHGLAEHGMKRPRPRCPICPRVLILKTDIPAHLELHNLPSRETCDICGAVYSRVNDLVRHKGEAHQVMEAKRLKRKKRPPKPKRLKICELDLLADSETMPDEMDVDDEEEEEEIVFCKTLP